MAEKREMSDAEKRGCGLAFLLALSHFIIVLPCWLGLLFGILWTIGAGWILWTLFVIYAIVHPLTNVGTKAAFTVLKIRAAALKNESKGPEKEESEEERFKKAKVINVKPERVRTV